MKPSANSRFSIKDFLILAVSIQQSGILGVTEATRGLFLIETV